MVADGSSIRFLMAQAAMHPGLGSSKPESSCAVAAGETASTEGARSYQRHVNTAFGRRFGAQGLFATVSAQADQWDPGPGSAVSRNHSSGPSMDTEGGTASAVATVRAGRCPCDECGSNFCDICQVQGTLYACVAPLCARYCCLLHTVTFGEAWPLVCTECAKGAAEGRWNPDGTAWTEWRTSRPSPAQLHAQREQYLAHRDVVRRLAGCVPTAVW